MGQAHGACAVCANVCKGVSACALLGRNGEMTMFDRRFIGIIVALACAFFVVGCSEGETITPVRDSVDEYSWSELSTISAEIAAAQSDSSALEIAQRYNLTAKDGTLDGTQAKTIELVDGTTAHVVIAGFDHDDRTEGGKAGITFIFADAVALRGMNNIGLDSDLSELGGVYGGWVASEMRGWLNGDFEQSLPSDLRSALASVVKSSCVVSQQETYGADSIDQATETLIEQSSDKLWIPALVEVSGVSETTSAAKESPEWIAPLQAEGSQYKLFRDCEVVENKPNAILVRSALRTDGTPCRWWLRSVEDITFCDVRDDGSVLRYKKAVPAGEQQGVVPCFAV